MHILEMDVQLTQDKQVVVHHDPTLERVTGVNRKVSEFDYDELPPALEEVHMHFDFAIYRQKPGIDDGKIPLLRDVFIQNPGIPINIDLKGGDEELMHEVYKLIIEFQRENITYFGDMDESRNLIAKKMGEDAGIRTFASIKYTILICVAYFLGVLQFVPFRHYSLWFPFFGREKLDTIWRIAGNKWKHRFLAGLYRWLTYWMKPMFWHLRKRGVLIMFWNINSEDEFERALTYSIDGILTDRPEEMRRIADQRMNKNASGSDEDLIFGRRKDS